MTVRGAVRETLEQRFKSELGEFDWSIMPDVGDRDGQSLLFQYPVGLEPRLYGAVDYIRPVVRLEFGCRGDVWPIERRTIRAYVAEQYPHPVRMGRVRGSCAPPERTLWEKITLLHAVAHSGKMPPRPSRHYVDVSQMYRRDVGREAVADFGLLEGVVKHKSVFFREAAARYDLAAPGKLKIVPGPELERVVRRDYRDMQEMFFGEAPAFDTLLADVREIETRVNSI